MFLVDGLRRVYRYFWFLKPFRPPLSDEDERALRALGVLRRKHPFPILCIPADKLIDHIGIPYASAVHYHTRALAHPEIGDRLLTEHFARFRPGSLGEVLVGAGALREKLSGYPKWYFGGGMPWSVPERFRTVQNVPDSGDCAHFGPCTESFIASEWNRLRSAFESIAKHGYRPFGYTDGFIRGFIIRNNANYNFVVTAGKHRAASVCLTQKDVLVRLDWNEHLPVVSLEAAGRLPLVEAAIYSASIAQELIQYYSEIKV